MSSSDSRRSAMRSRLHVAVGCAFVLGGGGCVSTRSNAHPDPAAVDAASIDAAHLAATFAAADIAQEFVVDEKAAWARWGYRPDGDGGAIPHHVPFSISGRLLSRDVLLSGPDQVRWGDPRRGVAACYVMYITEEMKRWPRDKVIVARATAVSSFSPGRQASTGQPATAPTIHVDCDFVEAPQR